MFCFRLVPPLKNTLLRNPNFVVVAGYSYLTNHVLIAWKLRFTCWKSSVLRGCPMPNLTIPAHWEKMVSSPTTMWYETNPTRNIWDYHVVYSGNIYIYNIYIYTVWVNFITTSLRPNPGIMVSKGNHPPMAELFRWVKYDNLPRYIQHDMIWMCLKMGYTVAQVAYGNLNRENYVQTRGTKDTNIFWAWECVFCLTMYFFCWGGQCWHTSILIHFEAISFRTLFLKWVWPTKG